MKTIEIPSWADYRLVDSGGYEKLEQFGKYILRRPEPQAIWSKSLPESDWRKMTSAWFKTEKNSDSRGRWETCHDIPNDWEIQYKYKNMLLCFKIKMTSFGHVGIFPEQADNWNYIFDSVSRLHIPHPRVLNLFAYTGGTTMAANAAGANVVHVDAVHSVLGWARGNAESTGCDNIRWILDDAMAFVRREISRGQMYDGIILDPPAYGRGPNGEKWQLKDHLLELAQNCAKILRPQNSFCLLNMYSMGFSALVAENIMRCCFNAAATLSSGELCVSDTFGRQLPLGTFCRLNL